MIVISGISESKRSPFYSFYLESDWLVLYLGLQVQDSDDKKFLVDTIFSLEEGDNSTLLCLLEYVYTSFTLIHKI